MCFHIEDLHKPAYVLKKWIVCHKSSFKRRNAEPDVRYKSSPTFSITKQHTSLVLIYHRDAIVIRADKMPGPFLRRTYPIDGDVELRPLRFCQLFEYAEALHHHGDTVALSGVLAVKERF